MSVTIGNSSKVRAIEGQHAMSPLPKRAYEKYAVRCFGLTKVEMMILVSVHGVDACGRCHS
jgi:hypothetical protein